MGFWQSLDHAEQEQALAVSPALSWELVRQELGIE